VLDETILISFNYRNVWMPLLAYGRFCSVWLFFLLKTFLIFEAPN